MGWRRNGSLRGERERKQLPRVPEIIQKYLTVSRRAGTKHFFDPRINVKFDF
jgi:hypothetical protein